MGNIIGDLTSAKPIILVDQNGNDVFTGLKVCAPEEAEPVIFVTQTGDKA